MLTLKQEAFVDEYFKNNGNCTAAALAAGYAKGTAKEASKWLDPPGRIPKNTDKYFKPELAAAIEERREELKSRRVADAQEILEFHTAVLRGELGEEVIITEGQGDGVTRASLMEKPAGLRDKQASAAALARILGIEKTKLDIQGAVPIVIGGENELTD